jgi:homoserine dehydrogenase
MTYQFARIDLEKNTDTVTVNWAYLKNPNIAELRDIYRTYCIYKHFASVMPLFDSQFTDLDTDVIGYYDNDLLEGIEGIMNGSTNYILTRALDERLSYTDALAGAQALGYAESNPELDVSGRDALNKLIIIMAHAFGVVVPETQIFRHGIEQIGPIELDYAREKGYKIKLVCQAFKTDAHHLAAWVMPQYVPADSRLFIVDNVFNGISTRMQYADTQFFMGKGAGAYPTASAVVSDLSALSYNYKYEYKKISLKTNIKLQNNVKLQVRLRCAENLSKYWIDNFERVTEIVYREGFAIITGQLTLGKLQLAKFDNHTSVVLLNVLNRG